MREFPDRALRPAHAALRQVAERQLPRVLTQLDRDLDSPTAGCFDRNHWHYKIRDYPSSILQQGAFLLEGMRRGDLGASLQLDEEKITDWTVAAVQALGRQVDRAGGVDEYYPYERSYPAAAFGLHAAAVILRGWQTDAPELLDRIDFTPLARLAKHLSGRFEGKASNQQAIGLAALAVATHIPALHVSRERVEGIADRFFALQHNEGWFDEYGGPDLGYLAVTLDALADLEDATGDPRAARAVDRAVDFFAAVIGTDGAVPGTLNSRNTDYVVPYGLTRAAARNATAAWLLEEWFQDADDPTHFLAATDDRYHSHYIYASIVRSLPHLAAVRHPEEPPRDQDLWLPGAGYRILRSEDGSWSLAIAAKKGGLIRLHRRGQAPLVDHGWRLHGERALWSTNFWNLDLEIDSDDGAVEVRGRATSAKPLKATPLKHMILRGAAWLGRERLIPLLKRAMIFRSSEAGPEFTRRIEWSAEELRVIDRFPPRAGVTVSPSPRQNLRHVASAESFHVEDATASAMEQALKSSEEKVPRSLEAEASFEGTFALREAPIETL